MKHLILASAFAAATLFTSVIPSEAATLVIRNDHPMHRMAPHHRCFTKVEKVRHHGHTVIQRTKVCK